MHGRRNGIVVFSVVVAIAVAVAISVGRVLVLDRTAAGEVGWGLGVPLTVVLKKNDKM